MNIQQILLIITTLSSLLFLECQASVSSSSSPLSLLLPSSLMNNFNNDNNRNRKIYTFDTCHPNDITSNAAATGVKNCNNLNLLDLRGGGGEAVQKEVQKEEVKTNKQEGQGEGSNAGTSTGTSTGTGTGTGMSTSSDKGEKIAFVPSSNTKPKPKSVKQDHQKQQKHHTKNDTNKSNKSNTNNNNNNNNQKMQNGSKNNGSENKPSRSISNMAKDIGQDLNHKIHKASSTFKKHTIQTKNKIQGMHVVTKQSLKSYMDSMKKKDITLLFGGGDADIEKEESLTSSSSSSSSSSFQSRIKDHNLFINLQKGIEKATIQWKNGSIIASHIVLGTGMNLRHDVIIWSTALILSLLGSSLGFYSFLYFVTVGFSVSIGLTALTSLITFNVFSSKPIPILSNIHTLLVILWSIRLTIFLLHREFVNWKEWHTQLNKTNRRSKKTTTNKIPIWFTCSTCYSCMIMPCVYRLKASTTTTSLSSSSSSSSSSGKMLQDWGIIGKMGIILQSIGLLLETIADAQKAKFKKKDGNRHLWCNVGLWSFSTYPNYLGEVMFWFGTYIGGISCCDTIMQFTMCTVGLIFILMVVKGAIDSLSSKHMRKWGHDDEWLDFKRTHSILGPIQVKNKKALPIYR